MWYSSLWQFVFCFLCTFFGTSWLLNNCRLSIIFKWWKQKWGHQINIYWWRSMNILRTVVWFRVLTSQLPNFTLSSLLCRCLPWKYKFKHMLLCLEPGIFNLFLLCPGADNRRSQVFFAFPYQHVCYYWRCFHG